MKKRLEWIKDLNHSSPRKTYFKLTYIAIDMLKGKIHLSWRTEILLFLLQVPRTNLFHLHKIGSF